MGLFDGISAGWKQFKDSAFGATPDYQRLAADQAASSQATVNQQTRDNRVNQYSPFGSSTWTKNENGQWVQNTTLNPADQANLDASRSLAGGIFGAGQNILGQQFDSSGLSPLNYGRDLNPLGSGADYQKRAEDSIYNRLSARLNPQWDTRGSQLETRLANQGLVPGTEAYSNAMRDFNNARNDAYSSAMNDAITSSGAEGSRLFGMDLQGNQQQLSRNDQLFGQSLAGHNLGISDQMAAQQYGLNSLSGAESALRGTPQMPQFGGYSMAGAAQPQQYLAAGQLQAAGDQGQNAQVGQYIGSIFGALGQGAQVGGMLGGASRSPYGYYGSQVPNFG